MPRSPGEDAVGSWTPGGQAASSDAGISSALAPSSVGGIPGARPGRGLWKALCLSWPLCLPPFAPPPAGFGWRSGAGGLGRRRGRGSAGFSRWPRPGPVWSSCCSLLAPAALPHAGSTPSSHLLLSFSQFISPLMKTYCVLAGQTYRSRAVGGSWDQSGLLTDHCYSCGEGGEVSDLPT